MTLQRLTQPTRYRDGPGRLRWEARLLQAAGWVIVLGVAALVVFMIVSVPLFLGYGLSRVLESVLAAWGLI